MEPSLLCCCCLLNSVWWIPSQAIGKWKNSRIMSRSMRSGNNSTSSARVRYNLFDTGKVSFSLLLEKKLSAGHVEIVNWKWKWWIAGCFFSFSFYVSLESFHHRYVDGGTKDVTRGLGIIGKTSDFISSSRSGSCRLHNKAGTVDDDDIMSFACPTLEWTKDKRAENNTENRREIYLFSHQKISPSTGGGHKQ